jgi:DNA-binding CsgD family transcriptional regulator
MGATSAELLAQNREISEGLHLSVRTVGNYLTRAYRRLGVRGRDELAAALGDDQLLSR